MGVGMYHTQGTNSMSSLDVSAFPSTFLLSHVERFAGFLFFFLFSCCYLPALYLGDNIQTYRRGVGRRRLD